MLFFPQYNVKVIGKLLFCHEEYEGLTLQKIKKNIFCFFFVIFVVNKLPELL